MTDPSYWGHAEALRRSLLRTIMYLVIAFVVGVIIVPRLFDPVILAPCQASFPTYRLLDHLSGSGTDDRFPILLVNIQLGTQFFLHMRTALAFSVLAVIPLVLIELWRFISPALYDGEATALRFSLLWFPVLFYSGVVVGYYLVFPLSLRFLVFYDLSNIIEDKLSLESYMSNFFTLIGAMGFVFLLPLVVKLLADLGLIGPDRLASARRYAVVLLLLLAAIITPSGDPMTALVVFAPLYLLYELTVLIVANRSPHP